MSQKIKNDQISLNSLADELKFHYSRGRGHIFPYLQNRFQWNHYPKLGIISRFPAHVDIEISTHCNMSCPMCYRKTDRFKKRVNSQFMEKKLFKKIIEECSKNGLFSIRLSLRGEAFMHPDVFDFIELAKGSGIKEISSLTNGLALTPEKFEKLVKLKFDWLTISFDGLGPTYESIRQPAKFKESLEKIKAYYRIKRRFNSKKPAIRIQTLWPAIKDNPQEFCETFSPYVDSIVSNPLIDYLQKDRDIEYDENFVCSDLYQRLVIGADGLVLLCSCDECGDYILDDVKKESIRKIWHGEKINEARKWFRERKKRWWEELPCKYCCYPRKKEKIEGAEIEGRKVDVLRYVNRVDDIGL